MKPPLRFYTCNVIQGRKPNRVQEGFHGLSVKRDVVRMNMGMFLSFQ